MTPRKEARLVAVDRSRRSFLALGLILLPVLRTAAAGPREPQHASSPAARIGEIEARLGGPAELTAYLRLLGDAVTRVDRHDPLPNSPIPEHLHDSTPPPDMLESMQTLLLDKRTPPQPSRPLLETWLTGSTTGANKLRA